MAEEQGFQRTVDVDGGCRCLGWISKSHHTLTLGKHISKTWKNSFKRNFYIDTLTSAIFNFFEKWNSFIKHKNPLFVIFWQKRPFLPLKPKLKFGKYNSIKHISNFFNYLRLRPWQVNNLEEEQNLKRFAENMTATCKQISINSSMFQQQSYYTYVLFKSDQIIFGGLWNSWLIGIICID